MDQRGDHMKMNFDYFPIQIWMLQTVRAEKVGEQNEVICLVSALSFWVMALKLSKKVDSLLFCATKKFFKASYIYVSDSSHYTLSENYMVYRGLSYRSWDISD